MSHLAKAEKKNCTLSERELGDKDNLEEIAPPMYLSLVLAPVKPTILTNLSQSCH